MARLLATARRLNASEDAASTMEYALMLSLLAMACLGATAALGAALIASLGRLAESLTQ